MIINFLDKFLEGFHFQIVLIVVFFIPSSLFRHSILSRLYPLKPLIFRSIMSQNRIVTLIDMDCFYCQVEARADPSLRGKPLAVVQYNQWKGGGIIAVNYEARDKGVNRGMRGDEAMKKCPEMKLASVPEVRGKADLTRYRNAGNEVIAVLCKFSSCVEKASIDEAYIDLTDAISEKHQRITGNRLNSTFIVGYDSENGREQWLKDTYDSGMNDKTMQDLAQGAALVEEIRAAILDETGFHCSAGISHNKILAKLACGLHKPNRQTVLPLSNVPILYKTLPLKKIRNLGGKLGDSVRDQLGVTYMGEVAKYSLKELQQKFGYKWGTWLYDIARGIDSDEVVPRLISKSIGCCKNFKGPDALSTQKDVNYWIKELAAEIVERIQSDLIANKRKATLLVISAHQENDESNPFSRSVPLNNYDRDEIVRNAMSVLKKCNNAPRDSPSWSPALKFLGLSAGKFIKTRDSGPSLLTFFKPIAQNKAVVESESESKIEQNQETSPQPVIEEEIRTVKKDDEFAELKIDDYRNSFFCKYFFGKRMRVESPAENETRSKKTELQSNNDALENSLENPIPSTSKWVPNPSTSNTIDNPVPSCSREGDSRVMESHKPSDTETVPMDEGNCRTENDLTEVCAECNQRIPLVEFLEHIDHHVACKLQKEFDSIPEPRVVSASNDIKVRSNSSIPSKTSKKIGGEKRKYSNAKNRNSPAKPPLPITMFFKRQVRSMSNE